MNLKEYTNFHFIGIGGMGMRALAEILLEKGIPFQDLTWLIPRCLKISEKGSFHLYRS